MTAEIDRKEKTWRTARFDEILQRIERKVMIDDAENYSCVGVRWYGMGAFVRERLLGIDITRKQQWVIKDGDIVYNKLFAWNGAFAIANEAVDGCIVSDKFPTYQADLNAIDPRFLKFYFQMPAIAQQAQNLSKGAAAISKLTLNPPQFWDLTIPLPPIDEQRRIISRLEKLSNKCEESRRLRHQSSEETDALLTAGITRLLAGVPVDGRLGEVLKEKPRNGWSARCNNADDGIAVLSLGAVTGFQYKPQEFKRTSEPTSREAHYWLKEGDLLITRSNTPELVGHAAIYNGSPFPCIYPDLMMRIEVKEERADKQFVHRWLMSTAVRDYIRTAAKGTSSTMKKITQDTVMRIPFPVHLTLDEQRYIVGCLDHLQAKVQRVKEIQQQATEEIDTLFPSILSRAFSNAL